jgi:hypothetical protein
MGTILRRRYRHGYTITACSLLYADRKGKSSKNWKEREKFINP